MPVNPIIVENQSLLPKTAARVAAGLLMLTVPIYVVGHDVQRAMQAKVYSEPDSFVQAQKGSNVVILTQYVNPYNPAHDLRRRPQDHTYSDPDTFVQAQRGNPIVLQKNVTFSTTLSSYHAIFTENQYWVKPQRGTAVVLNVPQLQITSGDILVGHDTYGWPPIEESFWAPSQKVSSLVVNSGIVYVPGHDVQRIGNAKFYTDPDGFIQPWRAYSVVANTQTYNPKTDVIFLRPQAKVFSEPEIFQQQAPRFVTRPSINYVVYNPATDVQRLRQQKVFSEPETFLRPAPFNQVIVNGLVQVTPLEFAHGLDIYDYLNGSVLLAWGQFTPIPQSYNIYVSVAGSHIDTLYATTNGLQQVVKGLTIASYNPSTQVLTPSTSYHFKVVAVTNGLERGEIGKTMTPSPTSVMLLTAMKRLWPFPNTGLD